MADYVPRKGELIVLTFDPQSGHARRGRRPALVVRNDLFDRHAGLRIARPITTARRNYPFHGAVASSTDVTGCVMVEQIKSIDVRSRKAKRLGVASDAMLEESSPCWMRVSTDR